MTIFSSLPHSSVDQPLPTSTDLLAAQHDLDLPAHASAKGVVAYASFAQEPASISALPPPVISNTQRREHNRCASEQNTRSNRFSIATIARERTTSVLSSLTVRPKASTSSLRSQSPGRAFNRTPVAVAGHSSTVQVLQDTTNTSSTTFNEVHGLPSPPDTTNTTATTQVNVIPNTTLEGLPTERASTDRRRLLDRSPSPSSSRTLEHYSPGSRNKMHQTSSRLLRMTDEERPFTRDFKDLFSTLMVSLPLTTHRVRFQRVEHTFTSEEAINNLGSLKFSQSNRMPDPKDPTRIVTTTTTTTFSMAKEMARSVCQRFMDAHFIEPADGKPIGTFPLKGAVWQLTPKGMHVLTRFCQRNGINQRHVLDVLDSPRNTMQLVILERDGTTDKLSHDRATVEVLFRRFAGQGGPNIRSLTANADADSLNEYYNGLVGVRMTKERKVMDRVVQNTFTGKAAMDWLLDCCTTVDRRETYEIAGLFVQNGLVWPAIEDKVFVHQNPGIGRFQPTKNAIYALTEKGQQVAGWITKEDAPATTSETRTETAIKPSNTNRSDGRSGPRDSNNNRLNVIVNDPALRLLFREFLRDTHCEENLAFYLEVREFTKSYDNADKAKAFARLDAIRESLAAAYGLYNAFLAPGSPCELNIDHNLRNSLAARMTRAVGDDDSMLKSLQEVVQLFREAQTSVFKLMSSDSVPKFLKDAKYANVLREHNFDHAIAAASHTPTPSTLPERQASTRVARDPRAVPGKTMRTESTMTETNPPKTRAKSISDVSMSAKNLRAKFAHHNALASVAIG